MSTPSTTFNKEFQDNKSKYKRLNKGNENDNKVFSMVEHHRHILWYNTMITSVAFVFMGVIVLSMVYLNFTYPAEKITSFEAQTLQEAVKSLSETVDALVDRQQQHTMESKSIISELHDRVAQIERKMSKNNNKICTPGCFCFQTLSTTTSGTSVAYQPHDHHQVAEKFHSHMLTNHDDDDNDESNSHEEQLLERKLQILSSAIGLSSPEITSKISRCDQSPILSPINPFHNYTFDVEVDKKISLFQSLSNPESFNDHRSPQYRAACFLLFDDEKDRDSKDYGDTVKLKNEDNTVAVINEFTVERYAFLVFLYTISQTSDKLLPLSILQNHPCEFDFIICNARQNIIRIDYSSQNIVSILPSELSNLQYLEHLDLSSNQLFGTIPSTLGRLHHLQYLNLGKNHLTGYLPSTIGFSIQLQTLNLMKNRLSGSIPSTLGLLTNLKHVLLTENAFVGSIPSHIYLNCQSLESLDLHQNKLTGRISTVISHLSKLKFLHLDQNQLIGSIPTDIGLLNHLQELSLGNNRLYGKLPFQLLNIPSLKELVVNNNVLTGTLPNNFDQASDSLTLLQLSNNKFTGSFPPTIFDRSYDALLLHNNQLVGTVPENFCSRVIHFKVDCSLWFTDKPKASCSCCNPTHSHIWTVDKKNDWPKTITNPSCPLPNIHDFTFYEKYWIHDFIAGTTIHEVHGKNKNFTASVCISPTGCYQLYDHDADNDVDNRNIILNHSLSYSTSSNTLIMQDTCNAVDICGYVIDANHPKRKGLNHLTQTVVSDLLKLNDPTALEYKALCWIMTQDSLYYDNDVDNGTLMQRFIMAMFFYSQEREDEISSNHPTCEWNYVKCDSNKNIFIEQLDVSHQHFHGTIISEIGLLTRLKDIYFGHNKFSGTIHSNMFSQLIHLENYDVSDNALQGTIPSELFSLPQLKEVNMSRNLFAGTLSSDLAYSESLESIDLENNLLHGSIAEGILRCKKLKVLNLSQNHLVGSLPTNVGDLKQLQLIYLNGNQLSGSIPWELFGNVKGESQIQELILQQNSFTGTIPTQIGNLYHIEKIVLSHNSLRGTIPYEIQQLLNISLLHLHGNMLTGTAPIMPMFQSPTRMNKNTAFITDCGEPSFSSKSLPIQCESCTMCCNSLDTCQINIEWKTPVQRFGFLLVSFVPIGLMPMLVILFKLNQRGYFNFKSCWDREEERNPLSVYSEDSVYCLIFSSHPLAWCIFVGTATVQALAFNIFLIRSNFNDSDSTWNYTFRCPGNSNSIQCSNDSSKTVLGWIMFSVLVLGFLGSDFIDGLLQLRKAAAIQSARLFFSGWTLFFLTALALFTSVIYNVAVAESDLDLITNTVFLLFINDFDEQVLKILESMVPYWMGKRYVEIKRNMLEKRSERSIAIALENSNDTSLNDGSRGEIGVGVNVHVNGGPSSSSHRLERSRFAGFRDYSRRNLLSDPSLINNSNSHSHSHRHSSTCASSINNSVHLNKSKSDGIMQEVRRETGLKALGMWGVSGTRVTFELEDKPHMNEKRSS